MCHRTHDVQPRCVPVQSKIFFFLNQKFIMRGLLTVHGRHIQTICKLRLCYALAVMYYQNLDAVSGRQMWASPRVFFFFFLNQKFIMRGSLAVCGRHIQTIHKLRLRYALTVMYYQNLDAVSGRQMWASPRVSADDVALSSGVCSRALTTGPVPNRDAPPDCPHHVPQPEPNTRLGQSPDGVNSP
jgi:ribosomal protein L30/L7E